MYMNDGNGIYIEFAQAVDYDVGMDVACSVIAICMGADQSLMPRKISFCVWAYPQVGRSGAGGSVQYRDQSYDAEKCPSGNSAAGAVPDDQLLLYVFGLHTADAGRVGGV